MEPPAVMQITLSYYKLAQSAILN